MAIRDTQKKTKSVSMKTPLSNPVNENVVRVDIPVQRDRGDMLKAWRQLHQQLPSKEASLVKLS